MAGDINDRLDKIEDKLDKLTELMERFARIEERQTNSRRDIDQMAGEVSAIRERVTEIEKKLSQSLWIERFIWVVLAGAIGWAMKHV